MTQRPTIRPATPNDYVAIGEVMFDAVHNGRSSYSESQRQAWVPQPRTGSDWNRRLDSQKILVAELDSQIVGFMSLHENGYIDFAYIRPSAQGTGLFRRLYQEIEQHAMQAGLNRLWVHASLTAQPAFTAMGFAISQRETVEIGGQSLDRFEMEKTIPG